MKLSSLGNQKSGDQEKKEIPGEEADLKRPLMLWGDIQLEIPKIKLKTLVCKIVLD